MLCTYHVAVPVFEMILADVVFVSPRLVDDNKLLFHQLSELYFLALFDDGQLLLLELSDCDHIIAVPVADFPGLDASRLPDQSSLDCKSRIPSRKISLLS